MTDGLLIAALAAATAVLSVWWWRRRLAHRFEARDAARRPRDAQGVVIGAEEIRLTGTNGAAVLLLHGFNDTPQSVRYLAERLHVAGYSVHAPRLPGHGCSLREMAQEAHAAAWSTAVQSAHTALHLEHTHVYVCGQSMGGALATSLAARHGEMPALVLLAPFLGMNRALALKIRLATFSLVPYLRSSGGERSLHDAEARRKALGPGLVTARMMRALRDTVTAAEAVLPTVRVPTLYLQSVHDNRIAVETAERHFAALGAPVKELVWLSGSGHIISADHEREEVAERVIAWFDGHR